MSKLYVFIDNGTSGTIGAYNEEFSDFIPTPVKVEQNYTKKKENISRIDHEALQKYFQQLIDVEIKDTPKPMELIPGGAEINIGTIFGDMMPQKKKKKRMTVKEARRFFVEEESEKLIDEDAVITEGVRRAEQEGIIFIDEIDKIAGKSDKNGGPDVSR